MNHFPKAGFLKALATSAIYCALASAPLARAAPPSGAGWHLAWNDEFSGSTLDTSKWRHWLLGARRDAVNSPNAVSVADGALTISTYTSGGTHYTGMISTQNTYQYTYGYIEARINFDSTPGMWSAFWMQSDTMGNPIGSPNTAGTEIDICEHRKVDGNGVNRDGNIGGVIHWDGYGTAHRSHGYDSGNLGLGNGYHVYGMEWTPTQHKFYINGVLRWTINNNPTNSPVSQRSEFIILSSEVSDGGWSSTVPTGGYGSLSNTTTKMDVDYVRVYRRAETVVNGDFEGKISPFSAANQTRWSATDGRAEPASARLAPTTSAGATVSQTVRGLLPDTGYTVTAWGNAGTTSPSLTVGARDYGAAEVGQTLTASTFSQASATFVTGGSNRSASVLARSNNSGSVAHVDDFLLRRHTAVNNGQLESGDTLAWQSIYGGAVLSSDGNNYGGEYAWRIPASSSSAGVEQTVLGLSPNTNYRLTAWTTNGNTNLSFGVKNHGNSQVLSNVAANTWTRGSVNFTTGSSGNSATIFAFRSSSSQTAYADSFFLSQPLSTPWLSQDVTDLPLDGTSGRLGDKFVIQTSGDGIGGTSDKMHFIYQPVSGDTTITARILGVDHTSTTASTGVMIRETNSSSARSAALTWSPGQALDFTRRTTTSATSSTTSLTDIINPPWVRLTRRGNSFTAYASPDGIAWSRVGAPQTIAMAATAQIGIPATSGAAGILSESSLDQVSISPPLPDVTITSPTGDTTLSNAPQSLRLTAAITDSGAPAVAWSKVSGPGTVTFENPATAVTSATFSAPGTYTLRCSATTAAGTGSDDHTVRITAVSSVDPALAIRFKLDENAGTTAADSSGGGNPGTANGGLAWQPDAGRLAGAAAFNGSDSYISVPDSTSLDNTSAFTLSYWFKANSFNGSGLVAKRISFDNNNSYSTFLTMDGKLTVDINSNNNRFTSTTTFNPGAWYHVAVVFDGGLASTERAKLYVNGSLDKTSTETSTTIPNHTSSLHIGTLLPGSPVFDGLIDEVRFHRRALSAAEITALHGVTGSFAPTVSVGTAPATIVNTPSNLTGSVVVDSGPGATAAWSKVSGPGNVVFIHPASPVTSVTFDQPGNYVLRLTGTNSIGQTFADLNDTIFAATLPAPEATITQPAGPVFLASTADALRLAVSVNTSGLPGPVTSIWNQISGPGVVSFDDSSATDTSATFSAPGNYTLRCTVANAGGTDTADVTVAVAAPTSLTFCQGVNNYSHTATFLRGDSTSWNSGTRDQLLAGRNDTSAKLFRSVFSFPLTDVPAGANLTGITLDLWTHPLDSGTGSISTLELRELTATPIEGSGDGITSSNGAGTGATWLNRTPTTAWTSPGGDFNASVLSTTPGFNATTLGLQRNFPSSSAFLAAAQSAVSSGSPLNLLLRSPITEAGNTANFVRFASDDHATTALRPQLTLTWTAPPAAIITLGATPSAITGEPVILPASVSGATSAAWSLLSGPGTAILTNPTQPATTVTFNQPGTYLLKLSASNTFSEVSRTLSINIASNPAYFTDWQSVNWPGDNDPEVIGTEQDPDQDGFSNLLEWALHLDPKFPSSFKPQLSFNGPLLEYTYTRRKTAPGEAEFQVLWSDTFEDDWSDDQVSLESLISETSTTRTVMVSVPATSDRRFLRVRVARP